MMRTVLVLLGITVPTLAVAQETLPPAVMADLQVRFDAYVALHRQARATAWPKLEMTSDGQQTGGACNALAAGIQRARSSARMGDVITPPLAALIRDRLRAIATPAALREWYHALYSEGQTPPKVRVGINSRYWADRYSSVTPVAVLQVLPDLPEELAYRLHGRDLVLVDADAPLVVDIVPEALPTALRP